MTLDRLIQALQAEEDLISLGVIPEPRWFERLNEVDVEVSLRLGRRPIIRRPKKEIPAALDTALLPLDLVLPDLMPGHVGCVVSPLHKLTDRAVVSSIERIVGQSLRTLLDLGIVIDVLFQIEIVLLGI